MKRAHEERGRPGGPRGPGPMLERMERDLSLTPDQRDRVEKILEGSRRDFAQVRESTHVAIERELTPAQRDQWKVMEERFPWRRTRRNQVLVKTLAHRGRGARLRLLMRSIFRRSICLEI